MPKRVTSQEGNIELILADNVSNIDLSNDTSFTGVVNVGPYLDVDGATGKVIIQGFDSLTYQASTPGGDPVTDPNLGDVTLLITAENAVSGTGTFTSDIGNHVFTPTTAFGGRAEISDTVAKFGTNSLWLLDSGGSVDGHYTCPNDGSFNFAGDDFTIEFHVYFPDGSIPSFAGQIEVWDNATSQSSWSVRLSANAAGAGGLQQIGGLISTTGTNQISIGQYSVTQTGYDQWQHVAVVRDGTNVHYFVDGTLIATNTTIGSSVLFSGTRVLLIGGAAHERYFDNIRITKGVARYTSNFTPPAVPFDGSSTQEVLQVGDTTHARVEIADGVGLRITDAGGTDYVNFSHDGTDFNIAGTNTADLNLNGLTSVNLNGSYIDLQEIADPAFGADAARGRLWVESSVPNRLMFTDDAGNDIVVAEFGTGPVNATGSPLDNQIAVFVDGDTIEGDANFTWTGTTLAIAGAGAQLIVPQNATPLAPTIAFGDGDTGFFETSDDVLRLSIGTLERFQWDTNQFEGVAANAPAFVNTTPSTTVPTLRPNKTDTDTGIGHGADQLSLIAGAKEMLRLVETGTATTDQVIITPAVVSPAGGATPTLAFGDGDTGFYENADDELSIAVNGARQWYYSGVSFRGNAADSPALENNTPTSTDPNIIPNRSDLNTGLGWAAADQLSLITGGVEAKRLQAATVPTTDATQTEIISIAVPSGSGYGFRINVMGTEDSTGDTVFLTAFGAIRNQGGATALIGNEVIDRTDDSGAAAWVITIAADNTTDALTVDVTGEAGKTIDWKCSVELLEV